MPAVNAADYVIVGAGSAGCVLANRLSEDPDVRVLLLEAGGRDRSLNIKIPAAFAKQFHTQLDWDFHTEPEPHCDGPLALHPARQDARRVELDERDALRARPPARLRPAGRRRGPTGWGWDDVLPYFLKAENNERGASEFHAVGGPLNVADQRSPRPLNARSSPPPRRSASRASTTTTGRSRTARRCSRSRSATAAAGAPPTATCARRSSGPNLEVVTGAHALGARVGEAVAWPASATRAARRAARGAGRARGDPRARARSARRSC